MKNLKFENACITEKDGQLAITEEVEGNEVARNLLDEIKVYAGIKGINLKLTKARVKGAGRKPATKYICPKCGKKVSSSSDDLVIKCLNCNEEFKKPEN